eukprot:scaffold1706_cov29-Tisochrysis_lutea.AAC.1
MEKGGMRHFAQRGPIYGLGWRGWWRGAGATTARQTGRPPQEPLPHALSFSHPPSSLTHPRLPASCLPALLPPPPHAFLLPRHPSSPSRLPAPRRLLPARSSGSSTSPVYPCRSEARFL